MRPSYRSDQVGEELIEPEIQGRYCNKPGVLNPRLGRSVKVCKMALLGPNPVRQSVAATDKVVKRMSQAGSGAPDRKAGC